MQPLSVDVGIDVFQFANLNEFVSQFIAANVWLTDAAKEDFFIGNLIS